jgi:hypothetical protein
MIHKEVEQGVVRPYMNTNLCREVLSMRLPPTQAGGQVLGNTFIDGAHMVLAGPARGQLHLLYQNSEVNEQFMSYFAECLCAHINQWSIPKNNFRFVIHLNLAKPVTNTLNSLSAMDGRDRPLLV